MEVVFLTYFLKGGMFFNNIVTGNYLVYKDRLETNLLQLFAHPQNL